MSLAWSYASRRGFLRMLGASAAVLTAGRAAFARQATQPTSATAPEATATGVVYEDTNGNSRRDPGEPGVAGVSVSNGRDIAATDSEGRWQLPVNDDCAIFVIKPRGYMTPTDDQNLPRYHYIHKPKGSPAGKFAGTAPTGPLPASIDFPLRKQDEADKFEVVMFGDPQPFNETHINYYAQDVVAELVGTRAAFGVSLGDIVHDNLALYEPLNKVTRAIGIPWHHVLGNHDMNYHASAPEFADETFERVFGPAYRAFEYGPVKFLVLNDVWSEGGTKYRAGIGQRQFQFIENYIRSIPRDALLVLLTHIPIGELPAAEKRRLFDLLQPRPHNFVLSAHYHFQAHQFFGKEDDWHGAAPLHQLIHVTACGSWWKGAADEFGLPHTSMRCGAPNGWSVITFDGARYSVRYQAARRPPEHQMAVFTPDEVRSDAVSKTPVYVNVFAGSKKSMVEMRVAGGDWRALEMVSEKCPFFERLYKAQGDKPAGGKLPEPIDSPHLWRGTLTGDLPPGGHLVEVRTTDMFGQSYSARRVIRVA